MLLFTFATWLRIKQIAFIIPIKSFADFSHYVLKIILFCKHSEGKNKIKLLFPC